MAKNCSVSQNNPAKESNEQSIPKEDPLENLFSQWVFFLISRSTDIHRLLVEQKPTTDY